MKILIYLLLIYILLLNSLISSQWFNIYTFSNSNSKCNQDQVPALSSSRLDVCFDVMKYSCSDNSTIKETFYKNEDCEKQDNQISYDSNICKNGQIKNCTLSSIPSLPPNSYIAAVYQNDNINCKDDSQIMQYNSIPLDVCTYGFIYRCGSKSLTIEKYSDVQCSKLVNKLDEKLGCVHNNPFYKVIKNFCT